MSTWCRLRRWWRRRSGTMSSPRPGSGAAAVYRALEKLGADASAAEVVRAVAGATSRENIDQALANGVRRGDIARTGEHRAYRYTLVMPPPGSSGAPPPPGAKDAAHNVNQGLSASLGTRCSVLPENRSQGTIAQALRAVLHDQPQNLDEIFLALPI